MRRHFTPKPHHTLRPVALAALPALLAIMLALGACTFPWAQARRDVILATTTSTQDSGLLDVLIPAFQARDDYVVKPIAVGTGQALALGRQGEADVLLVHAPASERPLVEEGYCIRRRLVMHNDFVIVGPATDPAGVSGRPSAAEALKAIAAAQALFMSRGDDSGTHKMELGLWAAAGIDPAGRRWYQETGSGMGQTLNVASEKDGYALADRGTYLARKDTLALGVLFEGDPVLLNVYHVLEVNSGKFPKVNASGAKAFADFLLSPEAQQIIASFGVDRFGEPLFFPDGGKTEDQLGIK